MKYLKMLGLAAVAAMALTAFLGAGTASASKLCLTKETLDCAAGWSLAAGSEIDASLENETATLKTGATVLDTCKGSTLKAKVEVGSEGSTTETVKLEGTELTWIECTRHTTTLAQPTLEIHHVTGVSGVEGTLTVKNAEVTVATIFGSCIYGYGAEAKEIGTLNANTFKVTTAVPKISGPCPNSTATWEASYKITSPNPLYISEG